MHSLPAKSGIVFQNIAPTSTDGTRVRGGGIILRSVGNRSCWPGAELRDASYSHASRGKLITTCEVRQGTVLDGQAVYRIGARRSPRMRSPPRARSPQSHLGSMSMRCRHSKTGWAEAQHRRIGGQLPFCPTNPSAPEQIETSDCRHRLREREGADQDDDVWPHGSGCGCGCGGTLGTGLRRRPSSGPSPTGADCRQWILPTRRTPVTARRDPGRPVTPRRATRVTGQYHLCTIGQTAVLDRVCIRTRTVRPPAVGAHLTRLSSSAVFVDAPAAAPDRSPPKATAG